MMFNSFEEMLIATPGRIFSYVDNDNIMFYVDGELVYEGHPAEVLEDIMTYLGIDSEPV